MTASAPAVAPNAPDAEPGISLPPARTRVPIVLVLVLFLLATGRWGSYLSLPGAPVYVGDVALVLATLETGWMLRRSRQQGVPWRQGVAGLLERVPMTLLLCLGLLGWTVVRAALGVQQIAADPMVGLRDIAPYAYAWAAVLAFLVPVRADSRGALRWVFAAFSVHLIWLVGAPHLPGWPEEWPTLGGAAVFTSRPDFDTAVLGVAAAFAVHRIITKNRELSRLQLFALIAFALLNLVALVGTPTRAGLLAGVAALGVAALTGALQIRVGSHLLSTPRRRWAAGAVVVLTLAALVGLSPAGSRVVQVVTGGQSLGTVEARQLAWSAVTRYTFSDASRTGLGVGFGPDFVHDSGADVALEGTEYKDVRSPHNYILGTTGRLGVAGGLMVALVIGFGAYLGFRHLRATTDPMVVLAALLVISLPVTAMLGVVLESPFGAIPYFWAIGVLGRASYADRLRA